MRLEKTIKNFKYGLIYNIVTVILNLCVRLVFLKFISIEYLGASSLFSSIFTLLAFTEAGVGSSITFSLYKPLAEKNEEDIAALMLLYKKAYKIIGIIELLLGISLVPWLSALTNNSSLPNLQLIYLLYLIQSVLSYFFAASKSLIVADQKTYKISIINSKIYIIKSITEIIIIIIFKNFILYLLIQVVMITYANFKIYLEAQKEYKSIFLRKNVHLKDEYKNTLVKNTKAIFLNNIGKSLIGSTDNIVISNNLGLEATGVLSNYTMIINNVINVSSVIQNSATPSIGNLNAFETLEYKYLIFERLDFLYYAIYFVSGCMIGALSSQFLALLNKTFVLNNSIQLVLVLNFYITGIRVCVTQFKETSGLYWEDRYKYVIEGISNFILSALLVKKMGIFGVLFATLITSVTIGMIYEQIVLFKNLFKKNFIYYFCRCIFRLFLLMITTILLIYISKLFPNNLVGFVMNMLFSFLFSSVLFCIVNCKNKNLQYYFDFMKQYILKCLKN